MWWHDWSERADTLLTIMLVNILHYYSADNEYLSPEKFLDNDKRKYFKNILLSFSEEYIFTGVVWTHKLLKMQLLKICFYRVER